MKPSTCISFEALNKLMSFVPDDKKEEMKKYLLNDNKKAIIKLTDDVIFGDAKRKMENINISKRLQAHNT